MRRKFVETEIIAGFVLIKLLSRATLKSQYSKTKPEEINCLENGSIPSLDVHKIDFITYMMCLYIHFCAEKGKIKIKGEAFSCAQ